MSTSMMRGPLPADTAFLPAKLAGFDTVLAMYHDQGLPVLKYATFGNGVNITLGLPLIRTSVDHGTALDLAAQGLGLAHVDALHVVGLDAAHHVQQLLLAGVLQRYLQLEGHVEMVFDGALVAAGDEDHLAHAGLVGFFHRVLDQRLVDDGQHLFRLRLGGWQEAAA